VAGLRIFDDFTQDKEEAEVFNRSKANFSAALVEGRRPPLGADRHPRKTSANQGGAF
jgi:hypothetical protein